MAYSRLDLIEDVLSELRATPAGQASSPEDSRKVQMRLAGVRSTLKARGVGIFDFESIEEEDFLPLVRIVAFECAGPFGLAGQELSDLGALALRSEKQLKQMREGDFAYAPVRAQYF